MTALLPVIAYERVSKNPDGTVDAVPRQRRVNDAYAAKNGLRIVAHFSDEISAWRKDRAGRPVPRPGWDAMIAALESGKIASGERARGLLSYHYDRLARNDYSAADLLRVLEGRDLPMFTPNGRHDLGTDADARLMFRIMVAMAIKASDDTSRRITAQKDDARLAGNLRRVLGGRARYGWRDTDAGWEPDPGATAVLRATAERLLAGEPLLSIYDDLAPLFDSYGDPVGYKRLRSTLLMPVTAGLMLDKDGKIMEQVRTVDDPPLDRISYDRIVTHFRARERGRPVMMDEDGTYPYPLGKLLRCGSCQNQLSGQPEHGRRYYACKNPHPRLGVDKPCQGVYVPADGVHELIETMLGDFADSPTGKAAGRVQVDLGPQHAELAARLARLQADSARIDRKRRHNPPMLSDADADEADADIARELVKLEAERAALVKAEAEAPVEGFTLKGLAPDEQRRLVADVFITPIKVAPGRGTGTYAVADRVDLNYRPLRSG